MAMVIHGLTTVNGGEIKQFNKPDIFESDWSLSDKSSRHLVLEILRPEKHNPYCQIVCYYFWDRKESRKVMVTLHRDIRNNTWGSTVYYFKDAKSLQHYHSRNYNNFVGMPQKYYDIVHYIHPNFIEIFGN